MNILAMGVLTVLAIVVLFFIFKQAAKASTIQLSPDQELQIKLLQKFISIEPSENWLTKCSDKDQALEEGQVKLWEKTHALRNKLRNNFEGDTFVINPKDNPDILEDMVTITKIAFIMTLIQDEVIHFNSPIELIDSPADPG
jgi:hypothetical protein